ncbi:Zn-ribbon domain-containing OB-fold protein [Salinisphaera aquimarina]|uniref:Zn-ribbon domain-containing OB-fold protein n=1 Tax=Salinisphaera aquimarina TaxID=2094031 RepID=A0ABV7ENV4_9GAMM
MTREIQDYVRDKAKSGRIAYQHCGGCGTDQYFARPFCHACGLSTPEFRTSAGEGRVAAVTVLHRAPTPELRDALPYAIALVDLDDGFRVMGRVAADICTGDTITVAPSTADSSDLIHFVRKKKENE